MKKEELKNVIAKDAISFQDHLKESARISLEFYSENEVIAVSSEGFRRGIPVFMSETSYTRKIWPGNMIYLTEESRGLFTNKLSIPISGTKYGDFNGLELVYKDGYTADDIVSRLRIMLRPTLSGYINLHVLSSDESIETFKGLGNNVLRRSLNNLFLAKFDKENIEEVILDKNISNTSLDVLMKFYRKKFNLGADDIINLKLLREIK